MASRISINTETHNTFHSFVSRVNPSLLQYEHVPKLLSVGQRIVDGELKRVIVCMPPQYFKTEVFGRLLPAYFLHRRSSERVGLTSYGADLAWATSEEARNYFEMDDGILRHETQAKKRWRTQIGGQMWAAGVGGPLLGFGYELGIVDDPTDPEKAHSPRFQKKFTEWWPSKFLSRQGPRAAILVVMQRLGIEDPIDWLLRREVGENMQAKPERWHLVVCDEVKSDEPLWRSTGPRGLPPTCTLEPDDRSTGEVLAPSYRPKEEVIYLQSTSSDYVVAAQRQQRPARAAGDFWKREWFINVYDDLPEDAFNGGKDWDTAYTENEANSASAFVESYRGMYRKLPSGEFILDAKGKKIPYGATEFPIYIHDVDWDWVEWNDLIEWMGGISVGLGVRRLNEGNGGVTSNGHAIVKGPHYIENRASGKSAAQALKKQGIVAHEVHVGSNDKFARSNAVQPVVSQGRVWVRRSIVHKLLDGERQGLMRVTAEALIAGGPDLDVNDCFTQALHRHTGRRRVPGVYVPGMRTQETVNGNGHR